MESLGWLSQLVYEHVPLVLTESVSPTEPLLTTAEIIGLGGGAIVLITGALLDTGVLIGVGSSLAGAAIFSAVARHSKADEKENT